jgi:uncharacterized membrane protein YedE/YeeE
MNKRTLVAGIIVLAIGIALVLVSNQLYATFINTHPHGATNSNPFQLASFFLIIGYIFGFAGVIVLIYGAISPDPIVHWNNNL